MIVTVSLFTKDAASEQNVPPPRPTYSPRASVLLYDGERETVLQHMRERAVALVQDDKTVGILTTDEEAARFTETGARIISLGSRGNLRQLERMLYGAMRVLDNQGVSCILVRSYGRSDDAHLLWERLLKSADGKVHLVD